MTTDIFIVGGLTLTAIILFVSERLRVDMVALSVMCILMLSGIVSPSEALSGFSNKATITVAAMFVLSAGVYRSGAAGSVGRALTRLGRRGLRPVVVATMLTVGLISAFINDTATVAIFLPLLLSVARSLSLSPSKLLMPLSFGALLGGVCTLIGTSTNILVSSIAEARGQPPFEMFEFAPLGLVMLAVGIVYMSLVGIRLIPDRRPPQDLTQSFGLDDYLTDVLLLPEARSVGQKVSESALVDELQLSVLQVTRGGVVLSVPSPDLVLEAGDLLRVQTNVRRILELQDRIGVRVQTGVVLREPALRSTDAVIVEAVVALNSELEGRTLADIDFRNVFGATVLAIRHRGDLMRERISRVALRAGDAVLMDVRRDHLEQLATSRAFVVVSQVGIPKVRAHKMLPAVVITIAVVLVAALKIQPMVVSAVTGCLLMIFTGCLTAEEAYKAIEWRIVSLLAGMLTLGIALEKSGAARLLASWIVDTAGTFGPVALVSAFYLMTSVLTEMMSNNATAAMLTPVAIAAAESMGVSPRPLLVAVCFAASASFMTPVGYQTNTLIYGPGHYKFVDFLRVGTPLNLICWLLASLLIPRFWHF